jgi:hypothetical protein
LADLLKQKSDLCYFHSNAATTVPIAVNKFRHYPCFSHVVVNTARGYGNFQDFIPSLGSHFIVRKLSIQLFTPTNALKSEITSTDMRIDLLKLNQLGFGGCKDMTEEFINSSHVHNCTSKERNKLKGKFKKKIL